jgi:hypothetical protein
VLITIKAGGVMKKTIFQSIAFSLILVIIYYGVQIGWGYYMTLNYVPDIINSYKSVDHLQQTISFGVNRPIGMVSEVLVLMTLGILVFITGKFVIKKYKHG